MQGLGVELEFELFQVRKISILVDGWKIILIIFIVYFMDLIVGRVNLGFERKRFQMWTMFSQTSDHWHSALFDPAKQAVPNSFNLEIFQLENSE